MDKEKYEWHKDSHDKAPYGKELARKVAEKLYSGQDLKYDHREYCGKAFVFVDDHVEYVSCFDGNQYYDAVIFQTKQEFIDWLGAQSDESLAGFECENTWDLDNQRITKERLEEFI